MAALIGKTRKAKFELHLKIYDLNNVPLVSGSSFIKWHLAHSMHAEHRGRTSKCPIANHRVDYHFDKVVPSIRMSIDKNNNLTECPIEFEIVQEFAVAEKITLGHVKLNLAEYVEESEAFGRDIGSPQRRRSSAQGLAPGHAPSGNAENHGAEDGIVRRYLMQDSKVNSTLKIGILVIQLDGERNFIAPPLRTAPVFGGIAGFMGPEQIEDETGPTPSISKPRDASEVQDLYRRTLVASWACQPTELPADECIEDIFAGGNGWKTKPDAALLNHETDDDTDAAANNGTLRPSDFRRMASHHHSRTGSGGGGSGSPSYHHHRRKHSASSDRSMSTVTGGRRSARSRGGDGHDDDFRGSRSGSLTSLTPTLSSGERLGEIGMKTAREVTEQEVRDDCMAWKLPGGVTA